jgi:hypothetical protein
MALWEQRCSLSCHIFESRLQKFCCGQAPFSYRPEGSLDVMASIPVGAPLADGQGSGEMRVNAPLGDARANPTLFVQ